MKQKWQDYKKAAGCGSMAIALKVTLAVIVLSILVLAVGYGLEAAKVTWKVTREERAMLKKYKWFENTAAELEAKRASIVAYDEDMRAKEKFYGAQNPDYLKWEDKKDHLAWYHSRRNRLLQDRRWMVAGYRWLATKYNDEMAKSKWRFANVGGLPKGVDKPLPREFNLY